MEHSICIDGNKKRVHTVIMSTDSFALLRARRKEIAKDIQAMRERLEVCEAEDKELEAARKNLNSSWCRASGGKRCRG